MSLELALQNATAAFQQNTAAIEKLIAALTTAPAATEPDPPKTRRTKKEAAPVEQPGEPQPVGEASAPSPEPGATDAQETAGVATATEPTYTEAAAAVTALIDASGRTAAGYLLKSFGAKNLKEVDPARYRELIAAANDMVVPF